MLRTLPTFPVPLGTYTVGLTEMSFLDLSRKGLFDFAPDEFREIPVLIFYPADSDHDRPPATYSFKEEAERFKKETKGLVSARNHLIRLSAYRDIPISTRQSEYPVLLFNHGYAGHLMQNTVLCSDLASRGYLVVSVGHPYESGTLRYPDGRKIPVNPSLSEDITQTLRSRMPQFKAMQKKTFSDAEIGPAAADFYRNFKSTKVWEHVRIWADDNRFVADKLEQLNEGTLPSLFTGKLKLGSGIGAIGHSYGGCAASQACLDDARFVCGINLDAPTYGDYGDRDMGKPFMILGSELMEWLARPHFLANSGDAYLVIVEGTKHMDFTDLIFYAGHLKWLNLLGRRNPMQLREIISGYTLAFFDRYLQPNGSAGVEMPTFDKVRVRMKKTAAD
ncbi:alpha/beta hydrolase family protein [Saccharibacillus qingshengii]|uniref:alpha/beta hydrolase family protein n=1 Tax=Saccharibacillus qingshengii TaxID=1763540 RepID=UPI0015575131|nr:hypothetical protein [Saccharibacillus qingshengii]